MQVIEQQQRLPLSLATSNGGKIDTAREALQDRVHLTTIHPRFDEDQIKEDVHTVKGDGVAYNLAISQRKLIDQRAALLSDNPTEPDFVILVSDSVLVTEGGATNRDDPLIDQEEALRRINEERRIRFLGALSFGRRDGQAIYTVMTYCDIPIQGPLTHMPSVTDLPFLLDSTQGYEAGFIEFHPENEQQPYSKKPVMRTTDFAQARPYISGLVPEAIQLANDFGAFDAQTAPIIEEVITTHPFNSAGFYIEPHRRGLTPADHYQQLPDGWEDHAGQFGGNCVVLSLATAQRLHEQGILAEFVPYPLAGKPEGHVAILARDGHGNQYLLDPGLSFPFAIPAHTAIPLALVAINQRKHVRLQSETDSPPTMHLYQHGNHSQLPGDGPYTQEEFLTQHMARILTGMHENRGTIKIDYHDRRGQRTFGASVHIQRREITIHSEHHRVGTYHVGELDFERNPTLMETINALCLRHGVDPYHIINQLTTLAAIL